MTPLETIRMSFKDHVYPEKRDHRLVFRSPRRASSFYHKKGRDVTALIANKRTRNETRAN
ncbi:unnamed protein product [Ectocarpus sp. 6 AP-2014]